MRTPDISRLRFPGETPPVDFAAVTFVRSAGLWGDVCKTEQVNADTLGQRRLVVMLDPSEPDLVIDWQICQPDPNHFMRSR